MNRSYVHGEDITKVAVTQYIDIDYASVYDFNYYRNKYENLQKAFEPEDYNGLLKHFINYGMNEGRQASSTFDVNSYRLQYTDLRKAYGNNMKSYYMHYIQNGAREGRQTTSTTTMQDITTTYIGVDYAKVYDFNYYISHNADLRKAYGLYDDYALLKHFVNYGMSEGRQASEDFNASIYAGNYVDLLDAYGGNMKKYYEHYMEHGYSEGRNAKSLMSENTSVKLSNIPIRQL